MQLHSNHHVQSAPMTLPGDLHPGLACLTTSPLHVFLFLIARRNFCCSLHCPTGVYTLLERSSPHSRVAVGHDQPSSLLATSSTSQFFIFSPHLILHLIGPPDLACNHIRSSHKVVVVIRCRRTWACTSAILIPMSLNPLFESPRTERIALHSASRLSSSRRRHDARRFLRPQSPFVSLAHPRSLK